MSRSDSRRSRAVGILGSAVLFGAYLMLSAVPAQAALTCQYVGVNRLVDIDITAGEDPTVRVGAGGVIEIDDGIGAVGPFAQCGSATVTNTDGVEVTATGANANTFTVDQSNGLFVPGESPENTGTPEIEFTIDLGAGALDVLAIVGTAGDDVITVGGGNAPAFEASVNLNGDNDADINVLSALDIAADLGDGNDTFSGNGGNGTGDDTGGNVGLTPILGGNGNDVLTGSDTNVVPLISNVLDGEEGNDHLIGLGGPDTLTDTGIIGGPGAVDVDGDGTIEPDEDEADLFEGGAGSDRVNFAVPGDGNDTIRGGTGDDGPGASGLVGGDDDDLFDEENGPNGADEFDGGFGSDTISYADRNSDLIATNDGNDDDGEIGATEGDNIFSNVENMIGGSGNDFIDDFPPSDDSFLAGGAGDDEILGDGGDDVLQGGLGNDTMDGEAPGDHTPGDDTNSSDAVDYSTAPSGVTVDVDAGTATGGDGNDTFSDIEDVFGSDFDDTILGDEAANDLFGGPGNDTMDARGDGDEVDGEDGNDTITDSGAEVDEEDEVFGGSGNDSVDGGIGDDDVKGDDDDLDTPEDGNDTLQGGEGNDDIDGEGGDDVVNDSGLSDATDNDDDELEGGDGNDTISSDQGDDAFIGDENEDTGFEDDGDDVATSGAGDDEFYMGDGDDTVTDTGLDDDATNSSDDAVSGDPGNDVVNAGEGDDCIGAIGCIPDDGDPGIDDGDIPDSDPAAGDDQLFGEAGDDEIYGGEDDDLAEGGDGDDFIEGNDDTDTLRGDAGEDEIEGDDGADKVEGGPDDDELDGDGDGASAPDTLVYAHLVDSNGDGRGQDVDLQLGFSEGDDGNDIVMNFEKAKGSKFDDTIKGGGGAVATNFFLAGGKGDDILTGSASNDTLKGAGGNDLLIGLQGADVLKGAKGNDEGQGGPGADLCFKVEHRVSCSVA